MTPHQVLKDARALIAKPENWCRNAYYDNGAMCTVGAIARAVGSCSVYNDRVRETALAFSRANGLSSNQQIAGFNDENTHSGILAAFDRAIAATAPRPSTDISIFREMLDAPAALIPQDEQA